jgi:putative Mg2+ transporter-C (MgtC) family protein
MIWEDMLKLFLAMLLGGIIGIEREMTSNPAGFRTHTLVCMGAALVMIISKNVFDVYHSIVAVDPLRMGAQVISGIGFLGAGTILKDGFRVSGLTTAASLWVVACVGLAIGAGFYELSIGASMMVFITLMILKKVEAMFDKNSEKIEVLINKNRTSSQIAMLLDAMKQMDVHVKNIKMTPRDETWILTRFFVKIPQSITAENLFEKIKLIEGISTEM